MFLIKLCICISHNWIAKIEKPFVYKIFFRTSADSFVVAMTQSRSQLKGRTRLYHPEDLQPVLDLDLTSYRSRSRVTAVPKKAVRLAVPKWIRRRYDRSLKVGNRLFGVLVKKLYPLRRRGTRKCHFRSAEKYIFT